MNAKILQKCIDELKQATPKIDYVLGMLETLVDLEGGSKICPVLPTVNPPAAKVNDSTAGGLAERDPMLDIEANAIANLNKIKNDNKKT